MTTYTVEQIDIDGDGIPDGDLITMWKKGKAVQRKFVPFKKIKQIVDSSAQLAQVPVKKRVKVVKRIRTPTPEGEQQPVQIQDKTTFGQYIKAGAGTQIGRIAIDAVASKIGELFA